MKSTILALFALAGTLHAAGTIFSSIVSGSGQDYASAVTSDSQGNTYVAGLTYSRDFQVTAGAYQTTFGGTCDAFVAKLDPTGKVIWATYLGGILDDWATGIAVDSSGKVWVTGWTRSGNFPVVNPIESVLAGVNGDNFVAFVAELDPTGSKLLYSTFLGGVMDNGAAGMALDSAGNVYVAVNSGTDVGYPGAQNPPANTPGINVTKLTPQGKLVYTYFRPLDSASAIAVDPTGAVYVAGTTADTAYDSPPPGGGALVYKISPDGSSEVYEKIFGGSYTASANAIAVDSAGEAWIGGSTGSVDFPLVHALQATLGARPIWQSANSGATWTPIDNLPFALPQVTVVDPTTPTTLYEATRDLGVFKSTNGGATWTQSSSGISGAYVQALAIDPVHTQTLYAATSTTVYKSTDGASSWTAIDTPPLAVSQIEVDRQNPNIVYEVAGTSRKSTDGGATWSNVIFPGTPTLGMATMTLDPQASGHLFAISQWIYCGMFCTGNSSPVLYRSVDGGNTWTQIASASATNLDVLLVDPSTTPSTIYDGLGYRSSDGGVTWTALPAPPFSGSWVTSIAVDPSGALYAAVMGSGFYASHDHGQTWTAITSFIPAWTGNLPGTNIASIVGRGAGELYATVYAYQTAGFLTKLSADGSTIEYSTYLRGHPTFGESISYTSEPGNMALENWVSGLALDPAGNVVITGGTFATDFPTANAAQSANAGRADAFAAILSADGTKLNYSTYLGGSQDDGALAAAIDSAGNVILAGQTWSANFPTSGAIQPPAGFGDAFVVKLATAAPAISSVLNAASFQPGIESGSWAMIKGVNLANTTRTWTDADFTGDNLPTELSGVSVTIDGVPAFPYYVSPTQINVQAPSDAATGAVNVVVTNNGIASQPATAQMQTVAPAFFLSGTNSVSASLLPGYTPVSSAAPAHPGDLVVLWGTGFGPTTPAAPAGVAVSGAPATSTVPTVSVGGMNTRVVSSVLTTGTAGLYQITIQLPAIVPTGAVAIQASIGGAPTQPGTTIYVAGQ